MKIKIAKKDLQRIRSYADDSLELLSGIEEKIIRLESNNDPSLLNLILTPINSLTESTLLLNFQEIYQIIDGIRSLLVDIQEQRSKISSEVVDIILQAIDFLYKMFENLQKNLNALDLTLESNEDITINIEDESYIDLIKSIRAFHLEEQSQNSIQEKQEVKLNEALLKQFIGEAIENISFMEQNLLEVETKRDDKELINSIFRLLHSVKGGAALVLSTSDTEVPHEHPLSVFRDLSHAAETVLHRIRDGNDVLSDEIINILLRVVDNLKLLIQKITSAESPDNSIIELINRIRILSTQKVLQQDKKSENLPKENDNEESRLKAFLNVANQSIEIIETCHEKIVENNIQIDSKTLEKYLRSLKNLISSATYQNYVDMVNTLQQVKEVLLSIKEGKTTFDDLIWEILQENLTKIQKDISNVISESEKRKAGPIQSEAKGVDDQNLELTQKNYDEPIPTRISRLSEISDTLRVSYDKIDKLMNLIGELIVTKNMFAHISKKLFVEYDLPLIGKEVKEIGAMINRVADNLQNTIMEVRMVPIKNVFQKFPRMIRDMSKATGKEVNLILEGEDTYLDKSIIEKISDPLIHLVRNSFDHGIENPEERRRKGKNPVGTIVLRSETKGSNVTITISDDGRGINPEEVKFKALEKNLITIDKAESMSVLEALDLLFLPGFSTAERVTEFSGRGVGLDVVKTNILNINGSIDVISEVDKGMTITLVFPLTLVISKGLLITVANHDFIFPLEFIEETVKVPIPKIHRFKNHFISEIRGEVLSILPLTQIFDLESDSSYTADLLKAEIVSIVILNVHGQKVGILVNNFSNEQEIVIKPLNHDLTKIKGISGATIMGDGRVVLILNPVEILQMMFNVIGGTNR